MNFNYHKNLPSIIILSIDLIIVFCSTILSFLLRFNFTFTEKEISLFYSIIPFILVIRLTLFLISKSYQSIIRYTATRDIIRIFVANISGTMVFVIINLISNFIINDLNFIPYSIVILEFGITTFIIWFYRIGAKVAYLEFLNPSREKQSVIIYGAGAAGLNTKRAIDRDAGLKYKVIAFIDDDTKKIGKKLEDLSIYDYSKLDLLFKDNKIELLIISIKNINPQKKQELVDKCLEYNSKILIVPEISKWINGELSFKQIKKIKIEQLLEREEIKLDENLLKPELVGKNILITGAAGSIGSEIVRQISNFNCNKIILLDIAETPLFYIELELKELYPDKHFEVIIGDITNQTLVKNILEKHQVNIIYHSAAYKHVPLMEKNPTSAILNNVLGTKILADMAIEYQVEKFVMISTDKAVNPTNVMGASKRIAEIYIQALNQQNKTHFITTRFGNVLGSNGSVIPIFREQIEKGGPITITHPEITRYFMTIPEACQLVIIAGAMGMGGEIFIFDMGQSIKIIDLAKKMIELSGLKLGRDIQIKFTGLRPGEKLFEELLANKENTKPTSHNKIMIANVIYFDLEQINEQINQLIQLINSDKYSIVKKMKEIIPEYISKNSEYEKFDIK